MKAGLESRQGGVQGNERSARGDDALRIVSVDHHVLFRTGLRQVLAAVPGLHLVGEASAASDGLEIIERERPDLVLMDVALPGMDGVAVTREVTRDRPETKILVLSAHDHIRDVLDALNAGAAGYALKRESPEVLTGAIRLVARGERYLAPAVAVSVAAYEARRRRAFDVLAILSERERSVFRLAAECLMAREIAAQLLIARKTVDTHLYRIHRKLGLRSSAELVRLAASLGMVQPPWSAAPAQTAATIAKREVV